MKKPRRELEQEMLDEYDFRGGVRGKYAGRFPKGSNVVVLEPDVEQVFTDSESVNQALRALAAIIQHQTEKTLPYPSVPSYPTENKRLLDRILYCVV